MKGARYWLAAALCLAIASPLLAFQRETTNDDDCSEAPSVNCQHNGTALAWRQAPVTYFVNPDGSGLSFSDVSNAVRAAFATWQGASSNHITFSFGGQTSSSSDGQDGQNTLNFPHLGSTAADTFAQSILTYDSKTGEIFDVDIELNGDEPFAILPSGEDNAFDPKVDVQAVATHEAGHLLGLAHENRFGSDVVMFFSDTSGNTTHRSLTSDDRSGVRAIYPQAIGLSNGGSGGSNSGGGGGGGGCRLDPEEPWTSPWPVLALLAALLLRSQLRRAKKGSDNFFP